MMISTKIVYNMLTWLNPLTNKDVRDFWLDCDDVYQFLIKLKSNGFSIKNESLNSSLIEDKIPAAILSFKCGSYYDYAEFIFQFLAYKRVCDEVRFFIFSNLDEKISYPMLSIHHNGLVFFTYGLDIYNVECYIDILDYFNINNFNLEKAWHK